MSDQPRRPRTLNDARSEAEAAFKRTTTKVPRRRPKKTALPGVKELVSLRIDQDVLEDFQDDGPGWQDRINEALRKAVGVIGKVGHEQVGREVRDARRRRAPTMRVQHRRSNLPPEELRFCAASRRMKAPRRRRMPPEQPSHHAADEAARTAGTAIWRPPPPPPRDDAPDCRRNRMALGSVVATISASSALCCSLLR